MKKILLLFFILISAKSFSQEVTFYLNGGYNFNFTNASSVNFIIDRYNQTRNYLTVKMDNVNNMSGIDFAIGGLLNSYNTGVLFEGGLTFRNSGEKSAEGTVSGTNFRRDFKVKNFLVNLGFGYLFNSESSFNYGPGLFLDVGSAKYETRVYNTNESVPDYTDITPSGSTLTLGFTPTIFFNVNASEMFGFTVRPYYYAQIFTQDLEDVNKVLNPNTWENDDPQNYNDETLSGFGVDLRAVVTF